MPLEEIILKPQTLTSPTSRHPEAVRVVEINLGFTDSSSCHIELTKPIWRNKQIHELN